MRTLYQVALTKKSIKDSPTRFSNDIIFQLAVITAPRLRVHHQIAEVDVLLCSPFGTHQWISQGFLSGEQTRGIQITSWALLAEIQSSAQLSVFEGTTSNFPIKQGSLIVEGKDERRRPLKIGQKTTLYFCSPVCKVFLLILFLFCRVIFHFISGLIIPPRVWICIL